ncbi:hypothetical protein [Pedobacter sp. N23S346]|uniref:hypothetical protein n=1 Tax=Pedobacter sp. N23S346 TaxID=3402750 RepID=UPI003ACCE689
MMRNFKTVLIIIFSIVFLSCKKNTVTTHPIIGEWELTAEINGLTGIRTNYEPGKGNVSKFTETTYAMTRDGKTIRKGAYAIITYQALITRKEENQLVYDGKANETKIYFTVDNNTLTISVDAYDGPSTIFTRIR